MRVRLHSKFTFFQRRIFPALFALVCVSAVAPLAGEKPDGAMLGAVGIVLGVLVIFGFTCNALVWHLVDEAYLNEEVVEMRRGKIWVNVPLAQVRQVTWQTLGNPQSITLHLSKSTALGESVSFMAPGRYLWGRMPPLAEELSQKIAAAKAGKPN